MTTQFSSARESLRAEPDYDPLSPCHTGEQTLSTTLPSNEPLRHVREERLVANTLTDGPFNLSLPETSLAETSPREIPSNLDPKGPIYTSVPRQLQNGSPSQISLSSEGQILESEGFSLHDVPAIASSKNDTSTESAKVQPGSSSKHPDSTKAVLGGPSSPKKLSASISSIKASEPTNATSHSESLKIGPSENPFATPSNSSGPISLHGSLNGLRDQVSEVHDEDHVPENSENLVDVMEAVPRYDAEVEMMKEGKAKVVRHKRYLIAGILIINFIFIFATWWWPKYWYVFLPFITLTVALNVIMVVSLIIFKIKHTIFPPKKIIPETPESLVYVIPCYNETPEELTRSLDSLVNQDKIDGHQKACIIIVDGRARGPGMDKSTGDYLMDDILIVRKKRRTIRKAYIGWTHDWMNVEIQVGTYKGMPYYCIVKQQNQGKRDSLIAIRSFLFNFNHRARPSPAIFSRSLFSDMSRWLSGDGGIEHVDVLVGMDADTVFDDDCVFELLKESRYPKTVGVCGYVAVDFSRSRRRDILWNLYQSTEYTISQSLRRLHQSTVTHKVSCLPGCCQLLKVCEETCGNRILYELFGYCPKANDTLLQHIRATASEDRNHVCLMLSASPKAETRQALRAKAYTDVPHSWSVFLSQRRRWTLGATSNDLFLLSAPGINWFERVLAFSNCLVWIVNIFIFAAIASLIVAALHVKWWMILALSGIMIIPVLWYISVAIWLPRGIKEKVYYLLGLFIYITCGPVLNLMVLFYALWNMDSFGWGKTRQVVACDDDEKSDHDRRPDDQEESDSSFHITSQGTSRRTSQLIFQSNPQLSSNQTSNRTSYRTSQRASAHDPNRVSQSQISEVQPYVSSGGEAEGFKKAHVREYRVS